jgi:anaerobic selenocysteine-containing dehydrogenase
MLCVPPDQRFESYVRSAQVVIQVSVSPSRDFHGIHFPGAAFVEEDGHVLDETGAWIHVPSAIQPPCGVQPMFDLLAAVTANEGKESDQDDVRLPGHPELKSPELILDAAPADEKPLIGVMTADPKQFVGGVFTSSSRFLDERANLPTVTVSRHDSQAWELKPGDEVVMSTAHNACRVRVQISDSQPTGILAVTAGNHAVRRLFPCDLVDGFPIARPTTVELAKSEGGSF